LVESNAEAVPLLWSRRRIDFFLARGDSQSAISVAKASNLVCEGAAFIAWDETEKVPVSTQEIYQPPMAPEGFAGGRAAPAGGYACAPLSETRFIARAASMRLHSAPGDSLMKRLRNRLHIAPHPNPDWERCRKKLAEDILFQTPPGQHLLELLERWLQARP